MLSISKDHNITTIGIIDGCAVIKVIINVHVTNDQVTNLIFIKVIDYWQEVVYPVLLCTETTL